MVWFLGCNGLKCFSCGGSLIDDRTVLTAAHCTKGYSITKVTVGMHYKSSSIEGQEDVPVVRKIEHGNYSFPENDFAILVLGRAVRWSKGVQPICLPTDTTTTYEGRMATATGWGYTSSWNEENPDELQELNVKVLSNQKCRDMINKQPKPFEITNDMLCTADENLTGGEGICQGDSGGPLITKRQGETLNGQPQYEQIGVVSWNAGGSCGTAENPDGFGRVTEGLDFIKDNMHGDTCS